MSSIRCRILGIDPGQTGAVGFIEFDDNGKPIDVRVIDCITLPDGSIDSERMLEVMRIWPVSYLAVIEDQIQRRGKGVDTMFINYGLLLGVIRRCAHEVQTVHSRTWKARLGLSKDKQQSIDKLHELMPEWVQLIQHQRTKRELPDRAEALLMAYDARTRVWIPQDMGRIGSLL